MKMTELFPLKSKIFKLVEVSWQMTEASRTIEQGLCFILDKLALLNSKGR